MCRVFDHSSMNVCVRTLTGSESFFELGGDLAEVHPMMFTYHFLIHLTQFKSKSANELRCNSKLFQETAWKLKFCSGEATVLDLKLAIQSRIAVPRREQRLAASCRSLEFQKPYDYIYIYYCIHTYIFNHIHMGLCKNRGCTKMANSIGKKMRWIWGILSGKPCKNQRCRSPKEPSVTCESTTTLHMFFNVCWVQAWPCGSCGGSLQGRQASSAWWTSAGQRCCRGPIQTLTNSFFGSAVHLITLSTYWQLLGSMGILAFHLLICITVFCPTMALPFLMEVTDEDGILQLCLVRCSMPECEAVTMLQDC